MVDEKKYVDPIKEWEKMMETIIDADYNLKLRTAHKEGFDEEEYLAKKQRARDFYSRVENSRKRRALNIYAMIMDEYDSVWKDSFNEDDYYNTNN